MPKTETYTYIYTYCIDVFPADLVKGKQSNNIRYSFHQINVNYLRAEAEKSQSH